MSTYEVLRSETLIGFGESKKLPGSPSRQTLWRWSATGMPAIHGTSRIILESCRIGGKPYTSMEAFDRFNNAINAAPIASNPLASQESNSSHSVHSVSNC